MIRTDRAGPQSPSISKAEFDSAIMDLGGTDAGPSDQTHDIVSFIAPTEGQAMAGFVTLIREWMTSNPDKGIVWRYRPQVGDRREGDKIMKVCSARLRFE